MALYPNQNSLLSFEVQVCIFSRGTRSVETTIITTCKFVFYRNRNRIHQGANIISLGQRTEEKTKVLVKTTQLF